MSVRSQGPHQALQRDVVAKVEVRCDLAEGPVDDAEMVAEEEGA